jgi:hypothetical protein
MIGLLLLIVIFIVLAIAVKWFVDYMELDPPLRKIVLLLVGLCFLIALLHELGLFGTGPILVIR